MTPYFWTSWCVKCFLKRSSRRSTYLNRRAFYLYLTCPASKFGNNSSWRFRATLILPSPPPPLFWTTLCSSLNLIFWWSNSMVSNFFVLGADFVIFLETVKEILNINNCQCKTIGFVWHLCCIDFCFINTHFVFRWNIIWDAEF